MKNKYLEFGLFIVLVVAFWNLFDWLYSSFITRSADHFTWGSDLRIPLVGGAVMGYLTVLRKNKAPGPQYH